MAGSWSFQLILGQAQLGIAKVTRVSVHEEE